MSEAAQEVITQEAIDAKLLDAAEAAFEQNTDRKAEIQIARLSMMQGLSPEIAQQIAGYKLGQIVHSVTRQVLSQPLKQPWNVDRGVPENELSVVECLPIIPVMKLPTEFMKWIPRDQRVQGGPNFEWKTLDQNDPRVREGVFQKRGGLWGTKPEHRKPDGKVIAPPVTDNINYLVMPIDFAKKVVMCNFCIATFAKTSIQAGIDLTGEVDINKMVYNVRKWERLMYLWTANGTDGKNTWKEYRLTGGPVLQKFAPDLIQLAAAMALWLSDKDSGRVRQEALLNIAPLEEEHGTTGEGDGNTIDSTSTAAGDTATAGKADPFAPPPTESPF